MRHGANVRLLQQICARGGKGWLDALLVWLSFSLFLAIATAMRYVVFYILLFGYGIGRGGGEWCNVFSCGLGRCGIELIGFGDRNCLSSDRPVAPVVVVVGCIHS